MAATFGFRLYDIRSLSIRIILRTRKPVVSKQPVGFLLRRRYLICIPVKSKYISLFIRKLRQTFQHSIVLHRRQYHICFLQGCCYPLIAGNHVSAYESGAHLLCRRIGIPVDKYYVYPGFAPQICSFAALQFSSDYHYFRHFSSPIYSRYSSAVAVSRSRLFSIFTASSTVLEPSSTSMLL